MNNRIFSRFHGSADLRELAGRAGAAAVSTVDASSLVPFPPPPPEFFRFDAHFHPYVDALITRLLERSVAGLQGADTEFTQRMPDGAPDLSAPALFEDIFRTAGAPYKPTALIDSRHFPVKELDFDSSGAYAPYNWEIFFHVPLLVAVHLSRNQRYEEAQRWFHFLFDPTDSSDGPAPQRFWKVRPFLDARVRSIEEILVNLATPDPAAPPTDPAELAEYEARRKLKEDTRASIAALEDTPFQPWVVARHRPTAYMLKTVMAYLDNLIAWGDSLFQQDTGESINEATQLYILAAQILGPRPQSLPRKGKVPVKSYRELTQLDELGNMLVDLEAELPFDIPPAPSGSTGSLGRTLLFCVPRNDKLLGYWDAVADRLFKIRNSLNLQGIFREVPLFAPPIDPALLVRAAAAGLDVGAVLAGLSQPLPLVRFQIWAQRASELCQEVKSLGGQLLSTLEKEDNEALAILRARQEILVLTMGEAVRYGQWQEAIKTREGLERSLANTAQRYRYYERLLGRDERELQVPGLDPFSQEDLAKLSLRASEPELPPRAIEVDIARSNAAEGRKISSHEAEELELMETALRLQDASVALESIGAFLNLIPEISADLKPIGLGPGVAIGGWNIGQMLQGIANTTRGVSQHASAEASRVARIGGYARREQEWAFQSNQAAGEIGSLFKQLRAAQLREAVAELELKNQQQQIRNAREIEMFFSSEKKGKQTTQGFYAYQKRELRGLYNQCFALAFDVARKAERALQHELGDDSRVFLKGSYLAGREGLLAGEKLHLDLKRMEVAYQDLNQREYELTKHVSLLQLDPAALVALRATGTCEIRLPEESFDFDGPGHYFRRIKSVAISLPCVTGPYASVSCRVTLHDDNWIRIRPDNPTYPMDRDSDTTHFRRGATSVSSIVTSSGQSDSGLFETNLRDERYLPFEGAGVISSWTLALPDQLRQFDYDTIADVILHVRYTAREGGATLKQKALDHLEEVIKAAAPDGPKVGAVRLLSVRHEFPAEWARFKSQKPAAGTTCALQLELRDEHYPFWSRGRREAIRRAELFIDGAASSVLLFEKPDRTGQQSAIAGKLGDLVTGSIHEKAPLPAPVGPWQLYFDTNAFSDLWIALTWGAAPPPPPPT
jgi:Tc toxin complex TcA C-terminal TcB-binding domain